MPRIFLRLASVSATGVALFVTGCMTPAESTESDAGTTVAERRSDERRGESERRAEGETSRTSSTAASEPRSTWREQRDAARESRAESTDRSPAPSTGARATASTSDSSSSSAQMNEMARELATLRAAHARLKAEKDRAPSSSRSDAAPKADPTDEKISASLKSYAALKQELATFLADIERARADNAAASSKLKDAVGRADEMRSTVARLEHDLRAEKRLRVEAEQAVTKLQDQLRAIARALATAGLSVDKLAAGADRAK